MGCSAYRLATRKQRPHKTVFLFFGGRVGGPEGSYFHKADMAGPPTRRVVRYYGRPLGAGHTASTPAPGLSGLAFALAERECPPKERRQTLRKGAAAFVV